MQTVKRFDNEVFLNSIVIPEKTISYTPIPHGSVINKIKEELSRNNLQLDSSNYSIAKTGNVVVGNYNIIADDPKFQMRIMFKNSYDKSVSFGIASGVSVFVCSNGVISGEFTLKRKHTGTADQRVDYFISESVKELGDYYYKLKADADRLSTIGIDKSTTYDLIGKMFIEEGIINSMQLNIVKDQLLNSQNFTPITEYNFTAWDLYNAVTESLKRSHPTTYIADHANLHQLMINQFA